MKSVFLKGSRNPIPIFSSQEFPDDPAPERNEEDDKLQPVAEKKHNYTKHLNSKKWMES